MEPTLHSLPPGPGATSALQTTVRQHRITRCPLHNASAASLSTFAFSQHSLIARCSVFATFQLSIAALHRLRRMPQPYSGCCAIRHCYALPSGTIRVYRCCVRECAITPSVGSYYWLYVRHSPPPPVHQPYSHSSIPVAHIISPVHPQRLSRALRFHVAVRSAPVRHQAFGFTPQHARASAAACALSVQQRRAYAANASTTPHPRT